jgi:hypothetical protein
MSRMEAVSPKITTEPPNGDTPTSLPIGAVLWRAHWRKVTVRIV